MCMKPKFKSCMRYDTLGRRFHETWRKLSQAVTHNIVESLVSKRWNVLVAFKVEFITIDEHNGLHRQQYID